MKIIDFSPFSTYPPRSGGQARIFNLNLELSKYFDIFQFSFMPSTYSFVRKTRMLKLMFHERGRNNLQIPLRSQTVNIRKGYAEYVFANLFFLFTAYSISKFKLPEVVPFKLDSSSFKIAKKRMEESDIVQVESPWIFDWVYNNKPKNKPIILVEHNVEHLMYEKQCKGMKLQRVKIMEKNAVEKADKIFAVSKDDLGILCAKYNVEKSKINVIPNGVDVSRFRIASEKEREAVKNQFGFSDRRIALFVGSSHFPNVKAVEAIYDIAHKMKDYRVLFLVAGSVGEWVRKEKMDNILFTGFVDDVHSYFTMADIAINPMFSGSGTNSKVLEYLSSGLPLITTEFGIRGLQLENNKHILISKLEEFPDKIKELISDKEKCAALNKEGRKLAENQYNWKIIAREALDLYEKALG